MSDIIWKRFKISVFLLMSIMIFVIYCITIPTQNIHDKTYTFNLFSIIYSFIILCAILIIDFSTLTKIDSIVALIIGLFSIGVTTPINIMGILSGICAVFAYLVSVSVFQNNKYKMCFLYSKKFRDIIIDIIIIISICFIFVLLQLFSSQETISFNLNLDVVFRAVGAGISEEVIFRMFIYAIILKIFDKDEPPAILTFLLMIVPFAILHTVDLAVSNGIITIIPIVLQVSLTIIPCTLLAWKRDLCTAIGVHICYNILSMGLIR